jgi:two-component system, OmpR family, response regulator
MDEILLFIVDDDKVILNLLEYTFKSMEGYEVKTFSSGEDCLAHIEMKPDLIVLDHMFYSKGEKKMSGLDTLIEIKKHLKDVPVIVLSGQDDNTVVKDFILNGALKYIPKEDYFVDALVDSVEKVIATMN